jgi:uncharacterized protein (TIGR02145 family)
LKDIAGDPDAPAFTEKKLTVVASGPGLTYQWYQKAKNVNAPDIKLTGNGAATPTYTFPVPAEGVANWGRYQYYCVVSNTYGSVKSDWAEIAVGCGAKTATGGWLRFMCHNLGASPVGASESLDAITFGSGSTETDTLSSDAKGWLFQWGRIADGHQWRSSTAIAGPYSSTTSVEVPSGHEMYGKFITNGNMATAYDWRTPHYDLAWRNRNDGRWPCPTGWKVPSSSDWSSLHRTGVSAFASASATPNTWVKGNKGGRIRPDGETTTLYMPLAGARDSSDGALYNINAVGMYYSCDVRGNSALLLVFDGAEFCSDVVQARGRGYSVRCVAL